MSLQIHVDNFTQLDHATSLHHSATITAGHPVLFVPGPNNSDDNHWQTLCEKTYARAQRIEVKDWHQPGLDEWRGAIIKSRSQVNVPVILIGRSFGARASASLAAEVPERIAAVLLGGPAGRDKRHLAHRLP